MSVCRCDADRQKDTAFIIIERVIFFRSGKNRLRVSIAGRLLSASHIVGSFRRLRFVRIGFFKPFAFCVERDFPQYHTVAFRSQKAIVSEKMSRICDTAVLQHDGIIYAAGHIVRL